jgi:hypothetical protein
MDAEVPSMSIRPTLSCLALALAWLACIAGCGDSNGRATVDMAAPPDMATLDPGVVSTSGHSQAESETHVAIAPNGYVAVAYIGITRTGSTNGYRFSTDYGFTFQPADALDSPAGRETSDPVLATDAKSNFYMSWVEFKRNAQGMPMDMHVFVAQAPAGTTKFANPVEVTDNPNGTDMYDKPWVLVTNDGALLVTYARTSTGGIFAARSTDMRTFSRATIVEDGGFRNLVFPCQPPTGNRLYVTYHAGGGIGLRWSDDAGATWPDTNRTAVAANGEMPAFEDPTCAAAAEDVWMTYGLSTDAFSTTASAKLEAIMLAHSPDGGKTIDTRANVQDTTTAMYALHPYLLREPSGALDLAYYAGSAEGDATGTLRRTRSTDGGKTWPATTVVKSPVVYTGRRDTPQWLGDYFGLAWGMGELYMSYATNTQSVVHVAFYRTAEPQ